MLVTLLSDSNSLHYISKPFLSLLKTWLVADGNTYVQFFQILIWCIWKLLKISNAFKKLNIELLFALKCQPSRRVSTVSVLFATVKINSDYIYIGISPWLERNISSTVTKNNPEVHVCNSMFTKHSQRALFSHILNITLVNT
jgi:hypothetical protein